MTDESGAGDPEGRWLQASCAVFLQDGPEGPRPYIPWDRLAEALARWREDRLFDWFYFVRKPPGLRLRFAADEPGRFEPVLAAWLVGREARNELRGFRFVTYEPETFRFGGPGGMAIAHQAFDADATAAVGYERLPAEDRLDVSPFQLSVAISQQLIGAAVDDGAEAWDVWCRLRDAARHVPIDRLADAGSDVAVAGSDVAVAVSDDPAFRRRLPEPIALLLDHVTEANRIAARLLRAAADTGLLTVGVRRWLAASIVFHWNRWGLPLGPARLRDMLDEMVRLTSPEEP